MNSAGAIFISEQHPSFCRISTSPPIEEVQNSIKFEPQFAQSVTFKPSQIFGTDGQTRVVEQPSPIRSLGNSFLFFIMPIHPASLLCSKLERGVDGVQTGFRFKIFRRRVAASIPSSMDSPSSSHPPSLPGFMN